MCVRTTCPTCSKPTYAGCGAHVEAVLGDVRPADRCQCRSASEAAPRRANQGGSASQNVPWYRRR